MASQPPFHRANQNSQPTSNRASSSDPCNTFVNQVAFLQQFLASPPPAEEEAANNLSSLLKQLDTADGVAQGVESRLDKLLENIEGLLEGLEDGSASDRAEHAELHQPNPHPSSQNNMQERETG